MVAKRIIYALLLIVSAVAFVMTDNSVALFFGVFLLAFPILSFAMLLVAKRRVKFDFDVRETCMRGKPLQITMKVRVRPRFFVGYVRAYAEIENSTFGNVDRKDFLFSELSYEPKTFEYVSANSGRIRVGFPKIKLFDVFGICSVTVRCGKYTESSVSPVLYDNIDVSMGASRASVYAGEIALPQKGNDHSEIFNVRDYAPGDSLNSVHWKLSGKFDALKTKEFGSSDDRRTLILVDMSREKSGSVASDGQLNGVLDVAVSLSQSLKESGYPHTVGRFENGEFFCSEVTGGDAFVRMVYELMSAKVNAGNEESMFYYSRSPECSVFTKIIFVTTSIDERELKLHSGADVTAIAVGEREGAYADNGHKIINMPLDGLETALAACEL